MGGIERWLPTPPHLGPPLPRFITEKSKPTQREIDEAVTDSIFKQYETGKFVPKEVDDSEEMSENREEEGESSAVSNAETLKYQLDMLIDDVEHLETEHLPAQGRIGGKACDCIAKAARAVRRHSNETIPIASRQGIDPSLFKKMVNWAQGLIEIGTVDQVLSGKHDHQYLLESGQASNYRKEVEKMYTKIGQSSTDCPTCEEMRNKVSQYINRKIGK